jgi:hypothetical protein
LTRKPLEERSQQNTLLNTLAKTEIIYPKNVRAKVAMDFTSNEKFPFWSYQLNSTAYLAALFNW